MVEIAQKVFETKALGFKVVYRILPWTRSLEYARLGKVDGVIGAVLEEGEGFALSEEPLGYVNALVYTLADEPWVFTTFDELIKNMRIGIVKDYPFGKEFDEYAQQYPKRVHEVGGDDPLPELIKLLFHSRIDAVLEDENVFNFYLASTKHKKSQVKMSGEVGKSEPLYIAFNNPQYAKILNEGIAKLRESGELEKILQRYNLTDWKKTAPK